MAAASQRLVTVVRTFNAAAIASFQSADLPAWTNSSGLLRNLLNGYAAVAFFRPEDVRPEISPVEDVIHPVFRFHSERPRHGRGGHGPRSDEAGVPPAPLLEPVRRSSRETALAVGFIPAAPPSRFLGTNPAACVLSSG